jgi:hypothetical protein
MIFPSLPLLILINANHHAGQVKQQHAIAYERQQEAFDEVNNELKEKICQLLFGL